MKVSSRFQWKGRHLFALYPSQAADTYLASPFCSLSLHLGFLLLHLLSSAATQLPPDCVLPPLTSLTAIGTISPPEHPLFLLQVHSLFISILIHHPHHHFNALFIHSRYYWWPSSGLWSCPRTGVWENIRRIHSRMQIQSRAVQARQDRGSSHVCFQPRWE